MISNILNTAEDFGLAFKIGSFEVRWYPIMIMMGFVLAICLSLYKLWRNKVNTDIFYYYIFITIPLSIIGARCWHYFSEWDSNSSFLGLIGFNNGKWSAISGLSIIGGVLLPSIVSLIYFPLMLNKPKYMVRDGDKVKRVSMWVYADAIIPTILIGQVAGRWGNFFNHELYGNPAESGLPWLKAIFPGIWSQMHIDGSTWMNPDIEGNSIYLKHPQFLYESFFNLIGFITIYIGMEFIKQIKKGGQTGMYFVWYGMVRTISEPFKFHEKDAAGSYPMGPYIFGSILLIIIGLFIIIWTQYFLYYKFNNKKVAYMLFVKTKLWYAWQSFIYFIKKTKYIFNQKRKENWDRLNKAKKDYIKNFVFDFNKEEMYWGVKNAFRKQK